MNERTAKTAPMSGSAAQDEELPYRIELWDAASDERRVLARAVNAQLGRAIFRAASGEYPESRIPLRRGNRFVADSAALKRSAARADS